MRAAATMHELPLVRALLRELLGLSEEDEQLPLSVIALLYKGALRAPLEVLGRWLASDRWEALYEDEYGLQSLAGLLEHDPELIPLHEAATGNDWYLVDAAPPVSADVYELLQGSDVKWSTSYDPVVWLHVLSWPGKDAQAVAALLEQMLALHPGIKPMLLDLAERAY